jgi:heme-degrading monooxygenase HmoA
MSLIARVWFGKMRPERLPEYVEYVRDTGVKDLRTTPGNRGVLVLTREEREAGEIGVVSFWRSLDDVKAFAGEKVSKAVYYPRDPEYLLEMNPELAHYRVPISEGVELPGRAAADLPEWKHQKDARVENPYPGVRVKRLWKGREKAHAIQVEIDAGARFLDPDRHEPGPEEVFVVSGVFNDGERDYPAGTFIHNPTGSAHVPQSRTGCVLFIFYPEG